ncbi:MAG: response regulator [Anaerolineales bacterium]|nr:response regulator [Anaerolineales bacterium]
MQDKPIALIVDDNDKWLATLEETLETDYRVIKARTLSEVTKIIDNKTLKIQIAVVDIRLNDKKDNDESGLSVLFSLNKIGIPCIATTAYDNGDVVRTALMVGRAKDVWFKDEKNVLLKEKVANIEKRLYEERADAINTIHFKAEFLRLVWGLLLIPFAVLGLFSAISFFLPSNFLLIVGSAIGLIIVIYGLLALFYNKITGEQFIYLLKIARNKKE